MLPVSLARRIASETLGTALLLAAVVGSGIMGERLAAGNAGVALLANTLATGMALVVLILVFAPVSGAHFNPVVSILEAMEGRLSWRELPLYVTLQTAGAFLGVAAAHAMFGQPLYSASTHDRPGFGMALGEAIATFGLIATIRGASKRHPLVAPFAVAAYIMSAYWFTSSTSFANPAVTLARSATDSFSGIRPRDVPAFIAAQFAGAGVALVVFRWLLPTDPPEVRT